MKNKKEAVDIIMATYNGEKYIDQQIESILAQSYCNFQLYIRDDCSQDKTFEIIEKYAKKDSRIKILLDDFGNIGVVKNFELLLNQSEAEYIMFSDQDDVWYPDKIKKHVDYASKCEQSQAVFLVYSETNIVDKDLRILKKSIYPKGGLDMSLNNILFSQGGIQGSSMMISKELKELMLPFPKNIYMHDSLATFLAVLFGGICFINEPLMSYRQHENNVIGVEKANSFIQTVKIFKNTPPLIKKELIVQREIIFNTYYESLNSAQKKYFKNFELFIQSSKWGKIKMALTHNYKNRNSKLKLLYKIIFEGKS